MTRVPSRAARVGRAVLHAIGWIVAIAASWALVLGLMRAAGMLADAAVEAFGFEAALFGFEVALSLGVAVALALLLASNRRRRR